MYEVVIILGLVLLNGVFSMSEIALVSARKSSLDRIPNEGDGFEWHSFMFEVTDMDGVRIDKVLVSRKQ